MMAHPQTSPRSLDFLVLTKIITAYGNEIVVAEFIVTFCATESLCRKKNKAFCFSCYLPASQSFQEHSRNIMSILLKING